ncbi:MAG: hydroxymethylbilane synthase [Verrucomicrobia bacterium CG_4_10_14_3_um_filter_43_23]|nr:MAG: hydroxymethylbilane synthase [Verrucomicrobia bacterium CG1_02_43_26]PIP59245.1 MAG: hydroxymethylbilane synthase [Verrucomicrobia bacterium CG22_combo_CG10-13_8_21_14_all_43_17]PIX58571.1 MAG: hydroxymethylbilane synthase [Verrucomicrobia bacterium CG_4_10_14_3_um_filter_43_23]PIY61023.1 MAG: hydroxymethylbilane synthase [Verrucomicrobia bacterium CG_4_10_14_0_8_um_filter_43_34]PJA43864.1 MAG: hydroxymethylbilane synthase [Verrucomicrobia bacterium CG_4_9_14_3_um_filter_43_20]
MERKLKIASRRSPLALIQTNMVGEHLAGVSGYEIVEKVTTGDKQQGWSLEKQGGKGLFTKELEEALLSGEADIAMHSAKDLPTELPKGLVIAGYLPRDTPNDVLILRENIVGSPHKIATASPRRRAQVRVMYPKAEFLEIRGNVATRLNKMVDGYADATVMAAAGLKRLNIESYSGLKFIPLAVDHMVPAVGQGAIAIECHKDRIEEFRPLLDAETFQSVSIERIFLTMLGGGCQTAVGGHFTDGHLHIFHEAAGYSKHPLHNIVDLGQTAERIADIIQAIGVLQ